MASQPEPARRNPTPLDPERGGPLSHLSRYETDPHTGWYDRVKTRHTQAMVDLLSPFLGEAARVLEIGPGHGHFAREIRSRGHHYDAVEPSDGFRSALEADGFDVTAEPVPPIHRPSETYDLVYASMLLENLPTSYEAAYFVREAHRVLRPGGQMVLVFPDFMTWGRFFFDEHYTHSFVTTPRRVAHLLGTQGFRVLRQEPVLGWFWVRNTPLRAMVRHLANVAMWPMHTRLAYWCFTYAGLGELHWKVRKTFFEAVVSVAEAAPDPRPVWGDGVSE